MKILIAASFIAMLVSAGAADFPITGTFRPVVEDPKALIQKLVINTDSTIDVTCLLWEPRGSVKQGKVEQHAEQVTKEIRGKAAYASSAEKYFDDFEKTESEKRGANSPTVIALKNSHIPFRNAGYEDLIVLLVPTPSQPLYFTLVRKDNILVVTDTGQKLKKAWW